MIEIDGEFFENYIDSYIEYLKFIARRIILCSVGF